MRINYPEPIGTMMDESYVVQFPNMDIDTMSYMSFQQLFVGATYRGVKVANIWTTANYNYVMMQDGKVYRC